MQGRNEGHRRRQSSITYRRIEGTALKFLKPNLVILRWQLQSQPLSNMCALFLVAPECRAHVCLHYYLLPLF